MVIIWNMSAFNWFSVREELYLASQQLTAAATTTFRCEDDALMSCEASFLP